MLPLLLAAIFACSGADDTDPTLPDPIDTGSPDKDTDVSTFPIDTSGDTDLDVAPRHTLTMHQFGAWDLGPSGGPYTTMSGTLRVIEYLDGAQWDTGPDTDGIPDTDLPPDCLVVFALSGAPSETSCDGCTAAFDVTFALTEGDPSLCRDPELPADGDVRRFGWLPTEDVIVHDYGDIGLWLPWYPGEQLGDRITFDWTATVGVSIEEEEEE